MLNKLTPTQIKQAADQYTSDSFADNYARVVGGDAAEIQPRRSASEIYKTVSDRVAQVRAIFDNNGFDPVSGQYVPLEDAVSQFDAPIVLPQVVDSMLIEAQEPLLQISRSFAVIQGDSVDEVLQQFPAVGALEAADIAYGQEYPERQLVMEGGVVFAKMAKSGLSVAIEEETIADSRYDLISLHVRAMGAALARHKEKKCYNALNAYGQVLFDNDAPASSVFGQTSGLGYDPQNPSGSLAANGAISTDDLLRAWGHSATQGFPFDTIYINPLAWTLFLRDPITRAFALNGIREYYGMWQGSISGNVPTFGSPLGITGGVDLRNFLNQLQANQTATSVPVVPDYFPVPLKFVPTPIVPYDPVTRKTTMIAVASGNSGVIVQKDPLTTGEWEVPSRDIRKIKASERYGVGIANAGLGVYVFKNIVVDPYSIAVGPTAEFDLVP